MSKVLEVYLQLEQALNLELMLMNQIELHYFDSLATFKSHYFIKDHELDEFLTSYKIRSLSKVTDFIILFLPLEDEYIHLKAEDALNFFTNSKNYHFYLKKAD